MFFNHEVAVGAIARVFYGGLSSGGIPLLEPTSVLRFQQRFLLVATESFMAFIALSVSLGLIFAVGGAAVWHGCHLDAGLAARLPRARVAGEVLGVVCLLWAAYHGCLMLEGGLTTYRKAVWALVPVAAVLIYHHLDYLFARALGGFLVLCATYLLHGAFAEMVSWRPLYCLACYAVGLWGMFLISAPWRFRDLLGAMARGTRWQRLVGAVGTTAGLILVVLPLLRRAA
jgi:hypothetical protein